MPKSKRPPTSGYARIAQAEEEEDSFGESDDDLHHPQKQLSSTQYAPIQPQRSSRMRMSGSGASSPNTSRRGSGLRRQRSNSGVDIKAINARFERWADEIAQKFKIRKARDTDDDEPLEIHHSVFQAPDGVRPATEEDLAAAQEAEEEGEQRLTRLQFENIVENVRTAIELDVHPTLISQGSSGSYFARNTQRKVVGVFKPKDEEPYASRNPKWTKWIHRNLFPFFFGRACLIPNLSYVSEAAAYVLDSQLRTNLVPYTDVVGLSSKSFHYDFWDRRAYYRKHKPFPEKLGSFQVFLKGFKDANIFLKENPWPDQHGSGLRGEGGATGRRKKKRRWAEDCRPTGPQSDGEEDDDEGLGSQDQRRQRRGFWTDALQQSFREQLEKLVILDYIMRNTDRGLDNWMIRIDRKTQEATIVAEPPRMNGTANADDDHAPSYYTRQSMEEGDPYGRREQMTASSRSNTPMQGPRTGPTVAIGAIDNSLSWPWKHPDAWRSYPFGWLFLPVSLIGHPFTAATRAHFLPLLTSKAWWSQTTALLRSCFAQDADFKERMFAKQLAVMKGQAWNVVEALKDEGHGPLELTRRARVCVWDDVVEVPVAMPLRAPSAEMRRQGLAGQSGPVTVNGRARGATASTKRRNDDEAADEMDITALSSTPPLRPQQQAQPDLLLSSPPLESANQNRFNLSRDNSTQNIHAPPPATNSTTRPTHRSRKSHDIPRSTFFVPQPHQQRRRFSLSFGQEGEGDGGVGRGDDGDEDEGDLGYAFNEENESRSRRVIVERLELVKGRNPVFTWC